MGLTQQVAGLMQVAGPGEVRVDRFVFVDVLAVVDGSLLDFVDGLVDFFDGLMLFDVNGAAVGTMLEMGAGVPQIRKSVEVCGMLALGVNVARRERNQESERRDDYSDFGKSLHSKYHLS
jgi:hypothetical protein